MINALKLLLLMHCKQHFNSFYQHVSQTFILHPATTFMVSGVFGCVFLWFIYSSASFFFFLQINHIFSITVLICKVDMDLSNICSRGESSRFPSEKLWK